MPLLLGGEVLSSRGGWNIDLPWISRFWKHALPFEANTNNIKVCYFPLFHHPPNVFLCTSHSHQLPSLVASPANEGRLSFGRELLSTVCAIEDERTGTEQVYQFLVQYAFILHKFLVPDTRCLRLCVCSVLFLVVLPACHVPLLRGNGPRDPF